MRRPLYISPTQFADWQDCARKWLFGRQWVPKIRSWQLGFGGALHEAFFHFLFGRAYGVKCDPVANFCRVFDQEFGPAAVFKDKLTRAEARDMGIRLVCEFMQKWLDMDFKILMHRGQPLLEVSHSIYLGRDVILTGKTDAIAWSPDYGIFPMDFKSAASFSETWFAEIASQLTCYILLFENYLGRRVDHTGFLEVKKNKVKGVEPHLSMTPRHSEAQLAHTKEQIFWMAEDIRSGRFPARTRMAFNSPCGLCDFPAACHKGDYSTFRKKQRSRSYAKAA